MGDYGACVETDEDENGYVLVRHSAFTDPGDPYLAFTREEWDAFLAAVRADGLRLVAKSVPEWTPEGGLTADDVRAYLLQCAQILDHAAGRHAEAGTDG